MKKVIYGLIGLLALFSILRAQADEKQPNRITIHPSLVQFTDDESDVSIGFGLAEADGEKRRVWNIFPLRIVLRSGDKRFYLALNGLTFLTRSGIHFGGEKIIKDVYQGDVISVGGPVTIQGTVQGSVWTFGADILMKSSSVVTGDVIAIGGKIEAERGARITGNKHSIPQMTIPFLGFLTSPQSAETLLFIIELFGVLLFLLILFLVLHFRQGRLVTMSRLIFDNWKANFLYLFLGLVVLPILVLLLIVSVVGVFLIPVILIIILSFTYFAFIGASVRLGQLLLGGGIDSPVRAYLCGLLGFFIIRIPSLLGRLLSLLTSEALVALGGFLKVIGTVVLFVAVVYSFGSALVYLRMVGRGE
jgi:hypothetical protein